MFFCIAISWQPDVVAARRHKAEETVSNMGKKQQQDYMINELTEQIKQNREAHALLDAQLVAQAAETANAKATLYEAAKEMDSLNFEKKQLLQQWQSWYVCL